MMEGRSGSLVFNVMRLTTPLPSSRPGLGAASAEAVVRDEYSRHSSCPDALLRSVPKWEGEGTACGAGSTSVLPLSMASIYASETFRCLLAMYNTGSSPVTNVTVHVELDNDATTLHETLYDSRANAKEVLESKACETHVLNAHLPEPGMHVLKCTATFIDDIRQIRTFRQFYRFNVLAPFEPSVSVIPLGSRLSPTNNNSNNYLSNLNNQHSTTNQRHFLVELKLLNATPAPIYIESVHVKPMPEYTAKQLEADQQAPGGASRNNNNADEALIDHDTELPYARRASLSAGDTRSFLFLVSRSKDDLDDASASIRQSASHASISELRNPLVNGTKNRNSLDSSTGSGSFPNGTTRRRREIGSLAVNWRSSLGESGVFMNGASVAYEPRRKVSDVELSIVAVPHTIVSQHPFAATCCVRNNSDVPVRLYLQVRRDQVSEIVPMGVSGVALPEILPGHTTQCSLSLLPLRPGQHAISGIRVFDMGNKKSYHADPPVITVL